MKKISLITISLLASASSYAGGPPMAEVPIGNDLAMLGISLVLAGVAARVIAGRAQK